MMFGFNVIRFHVLQKRAVNSLSEIEPVNK